MSVICHACNGNGMVLGCQCYACDGTGSGPQQETVESPNWLTVRLKAVEAPDGFRMNDPRKPPMPVTSFGSEEGHTCQGKPNPDCRGCWPDEARIEVSSGNFYEIIEEVVATTSFSEPEEMRNALRKIAVLAIAGQQLLDSR